MRSSAVQVMTMALGAVGGEGLPAQRAASGRASPRHRRPALRRRALTSGAYARRGRRHPNGAQE